jgi:hypothetical protein
MTYVPIKGAYGSFVTPTGELDRAAFSAWVGISEATKTLETVHSFLDKQLKGVGSN